MDPFLLVVGLLTLASLWIVVRVLIGAPRSVRLCYGVWALILAAPLWPVVEYPLKGWGALGMAITAGPVYLGVTLIAWWFFRLKLRVEDPDFGNHHSQYFGAFLGAAFLMYLLFFVISTLVMAKSDC